MVKSCNQERAANLYEENHLGLTPFQLACSLGNEQLFEELIELVAIEFWTYSSITCCGYPLDSIDSLMVRTTAPNNASNASSNNNNNNQQQQPPSRRRRSSSQQHSSALAIILQSSQSTPEQKARLLSCEVMQKLLEEKWNVFARRHFIRRFAQVMAYLICMSVAIYLRRGAGESSSRHQDEPNTSGGGGGGGTLGPRQTVSLGGKVFDSNH